MLFQNWNQHRVSYFSPMFDSWFKTDKKIDSSVINGDICTNGQFCGSFKKRFGMFLECEGCRKIESDPQLLYEKVLFDLAGVWPVLEQSSHE